MGARSRKSSVNFRGCHFDRPPVLLRRGLRKELAKKASEGHSDEIRKLLKTYGAEKLSDVDPKDYEDLFLEAQGVGQ